MKALIMTILLLMASLTKNGLAQEHIVELINQGRFEDAVLECTRFIEVDSTNPEVYRMRAEIALEFENHNIAFRDLSRAIELTERKDFELWALMGHTLFQLEKVEMALNTFRLVYYNDSAASSVNYNIGLCLYTLGRFDEAIPFLKTEIRLSPSEKDSYGVLSEVYQELGMLEESEQILLKRDKIESTK